MHNSIGKGEKEKGMQIANKQLASIRSKCTIYLTNATSGFQGFVFSEYYKKTFEFHNEVEMLLGLNDLFDDIDFPQAAYQTRSFFDKPIPKIIRKVEDTLENKPNLTIDNSKTTFIVNVQYRQNASWQGSITWVEQSRTQQFRSAFEMIQLMNEAVSQGQIQKISWEE